MQIIYNIARFVVGGLFVFSGLIKVNDPVGTAIKLEEYFHVFAIDFSPVFLSFVPYVLFLSVVLSVLEVVLGIAVLLNYKMKITSWVLLLMIVFFTFLTFYSAYYNKVTDCGCFGDAIKLTPWQSFYKDLVLLALIVILFFNTKRSKPVFSMKAGHMIIAFTVVINVIIATYAIEHLPYIDFRAYKVGADIQALMKPSAPLEYEYVMEKDGKTETFDTYPSGDEYTFTEMILKNPEVQPKIFDYSIWNDEGDYTAQTFEGNKLVIIINNAKKAEKENFGEINDLVAALDPRQVEPLVFTASGRDEFELFRHEVQLAVPYYFADATVLKTIVRSNPGLVLLQNGVVKAKWHYNDVPGADEVTGLLNSGGNRQ